MTINPGGGGSNGPHGNTKSAADKSSGITINTSPGSPHWGGGADIEKQFVTPFLQKKFGIAYGSGKRTPAENAAVGGAADSDHLTTNTTSSAADYPTNDGAEAANALGRAMGRNGDSVGTYDRFTVVADGYAFSTQILWAVEGHYDHIHVGIQLDGKTNAPDTIDATVTGGGAGGSSGSGGAGSFSEEDIFAIGRAAAISTQLELPGLLNYEAAMLMTGSKSIYNDEPLLPFIQQLAQASLRSFQSLPDGTFFAFYPDHFGTYNHRKPYWVIDDIEVMDGSIELSDEALATHVFVVGDTTPDGQISVPEMVSSTGVVTVFDAFASSFMIKKDDAREGAKKDQRKVLDRGAAMSFLRRYGVRPHYEEATFIRNHMFEMFYAFTQFQLLWSRQFLTQFSFTFMPELYPGGVVAFADHGIRCYIDSVTHTFDYTGGFTTQANLSAPAAYGKGATDVSQGMIRPLTNKQFKKLKQSSGEASDGQGKN